MKMQEMPQNVWTECRRYAKALGLHADVNVCYSTDNVWQASVGNFKGRYMEGTDAAELCLKSLLQKLKDEARGRRDALVEALRINDKAE